MRGGRQVCGKEPHNPVLVHRSGTAEQVVQKSGAAGAASRPQGSPPAKPLMEKTKIGLSPESTGFYYDDEV
jgi:hypothetical protein